ncbi:DUF2752 domain-containing protein [Rhodococcus triatomae]|uniref:DUF2752 domain-containing protein n=1 Tax=Rhodococcus triatomae TaxID=300028 RepID=A0A1G8IMM0_9NOCA|nr:DUF2752 domain-containing protein [Rhodococcus triatomae]QNG21092.1 DUF2752 domain-containing protein [Rhodococcus triatomae]QNG22996.1 DUF2752 domain-containing protein [Rhodococcus triatomae]SDI20027.1 Protein of unknown function [Rhodococcus triatomae]
MGAPEVSQRVGAVAALRVPAAVAGSAVAAAAVLRFRDPHVSGSYGVCPVFALTGLWCPACGGLRAVHDLTRADLAGAMSNNALIVPLLVAAVVGWAIWVRRRWVRASTTQDIRPSPLFGRATGIVAGGIVVAVLAVFTVLRNTPWGSWLAPA